MDIFWTNLKHITSQQKHGLTFFIFLFFSSIYDVLKSTYVYTFSIFDLSLSFLFLCFSLVVSPLSLSPYKTKSTPFIHTSYVSLLHRKEIIKKYKKQKNTKQKQRRKQEQDTYLTSQLKRNTFVYIYIYIYIITFTPHLVIIPPPPPYRMIKMIRYSLLTLCVVVLTAVSAQVGGHGQRHRSKKGKARRKNGKQKHLRHSRGKYNYN